MRRHSGKQLTALALLVLTAVPNGRAARAQGVPAQRATPGPYVEEVMAAVHTHWHPSRAFAAAYLPGHLTTVADRQIIVEARIRADGSLEDTSVHSSCGLAILDQEAVRALRRSAPLPPPPPSIHEPWGGITLRIGFTLDLSVVRFQREVLRRMRGSWRPLEPLRAETKLDHLAVVGISLRSDGSLAQAVLESPSGLRSLDALVLAAVQRVAPFPAPPPELVAPDVGPTLFIGFLMRADRNDQLWVFRDGQRPAGLNVHARSTISRALAPQ